jgi:hypothetical protein
VSAIEPHCSRGAQPGGIQVDAGASRADSRGSGVGLAPGPQAFFFTLALPHAFLIALFTKQNGVIKQDGEARQAQKTIHGDEERKTRATGSPNSTSICTNNDTGST